MCVYTLFQKKFYLSIMLINTYLSNKSYVLVSCFSGTLHVNVISKKALLMVLHLISYLKTLTLNECLNMPIICYALPDCQVVCTTVLSCKGKIIWNNFDFNHYCTAHIEWTQTNLVDDIVNCTALLYSLQTLYSSDPMLCLVTTLLLTCKIILMALALPYQFASCFIWVL